MQSVHLWLKHSICGLSGQCVTMRQNHTNDVVEGRKLWSEKENYRRGITHSTTVGGTWDLARANRQPQLGHMTTNHQGENQRERDRKREGARERCAHPIYPQCVFQFRDTAQDNLQTQRI